MSVGFVFKFISKSRLSARSFLFKSKMLTFSSVHGNSFWFAKFFAIKALMFTDDMVPNLFQVTFTLILTIGFKKGLKCSGVI